MEAMLCVPAVNSLLINHFLPSPRLTLAHCPHIDGVSRLSTEWQHIAGIGSDTTKYGLGYTPIHK